MEELLREAYGEHFELIKTKLTNQGWLCVDYFANIYPQYSPALWDKVFMMGKDYFRPKKISSCQSNETSEGVTQEDLDREFKNECAMRAMEGMLANSALFNSQMVNDREMDWLVGKSFSIAGKMLEHTKR